MKTAKWIKGMISFIMICALFTVVLPSNDVHAASSTKAKVVTKTYKEKKFLKYPQVSGVQSTAAQKKINTVLYTHIQGSYKRYLQLRKDMEDYKKEANCKEYPSSCAYDYSTSYKVKYNSKGKLSMIVLDWMYSGGAHGLGNVTTYNFNLKTGNQFKLNDILTTQSKFTKVTKYTKKYMVNHPTIFFSDDDMLHDFKVTNANSFYFIDNGFYLIFQEYDVAPYAAGNPIIKVPRSVYK